MCAQELPTPAEHRSQIEAYRVEERIYKQYADALRTALQGACAHALPEALVQARAKTVPSFAEKCVRKWAKYKDPVHQINDLCGARVVVQTLEQVVAVRRFVKANFEVLDEDEKALKLDDDRFGYRDLHFVVRLRPDRELGIPAETRALIGDRRAEIQIRTWVQHAWADTVHDRIYKAKLRPSFEMRRTGSLLAALMEDGDRNFSDLANTIDGREANYTAYAACDEVEREIEVRRLILAGETAPARRSVLALRLAQLIADARGDYTEVVSLLKEHADAGGDPRTELRAEYGHALCQLHRGAATSPPYRDGQRLLRESAELCERPELDVVPNERRLQSLRARTRARLAWTYTCEGGPQNEVRDNLRRALEWEPENPYYLAEMLGFERQWKILLGMPASTHLAIQRAIATCAQHASAGIEMPFACFTAGRLSLLLADPHDEKHGAAYAALGWYARGLRHIRATDACVAPGAIERELAFLPRLYSPDREPSEVAWVRSLLELATMAEPKPSPDRFQPSATGAPPPLAKLAAPVLIVAGGASTLPADKKDYVRGVLAEAFAERTGTVIAGGTTAGVPGCVADAARGRPPGSFLLVSYTPSRFPADGPVDPAYTRVACQERDFSPEQILVMWADLLRAGLRPADVLVLGFGGGPLTALEYRIGLAMGATVAVATGVGGPLVAEGILDDPLWATDPCLLPVPDDRLSLLAMLHPPADPFRDHPDGARLIEEMARDLHARYLESARNALPENLRPWGELGEGYRESNRQQARQAIAILRAVGLDVRPAAGGRDAVLAFAPDQRERMAMLEHARWNAERLRAGWKPGVARDNERKINPYIAPWEALNGSTRDKDRAAIDQFPELLRRAGLEVFEPRRA